MSIAANPLIKRQDTNMRQARSPREKLSAALRFLASGMSLENLKYIISPQRLGVIVPEICKAIISVLKQYMKMRPLKTEEWMAERSECIQMACDAFIAFTPTLPFGMAWRGGFLSIWKSK